MEVEGQVKRIGSLFSVILGLQLVGAFSLSLDLLVLGVVVAGHFSSPAEDCLRVNTEVRGVFHQRVAELTSRTEARLQHLDRLMVSLSVVEEFLQRQAVLRGREVAVDAALSPLTQVDYVAGGFFSDIHMRGRR